MIRLDPNIPYSEVLGQTHDNCRYRQGKYRFTADGNVIGDTIKLELEAKQEKMAILQGQMDQYKLEAQKMQQEMENLAVEGASAIPDMAPAPEDLPAGLNFQQSPNPTQQAPIAKPAGLPNSLEIAASSIPARPAVA